MKKLLRFPVLFIIISASAELFAQPGCPAVNAGPDVIMPCGQTCTTLTATPFAAAATTSYTVGQIPYAPPFPFNAGTNILVAIDDVWGNVINLPFNFCFFGNVYNQLVVGSNGMISFNLNNANGLNNWQIQGPIPASYWGDMCNTIMCPWQDIDPTNQGGVYYQISGTYPCRSFEVSWYQTPYYGDPNSVSTASCPNPLFATQQVVLYEVSNVIEMYIQNKEVCPGWNNGRAIQGILGPGCTTAYTVPGRNATQWTAQNDAWRFTPSGTPNFTLTWYDSAGTQLSNTGTVQVCPSTSQSYTAQAVYSNCDGTQTTVSDNVFVGISGISISIDSTNNPLCSGGSTGSAYASFTSTGSAVLSYGWNPGGAPNQTSITNVQAGTYVFSVTDATNCTRYDTVTLVDPAPLVVNVPDSNAYNCNPGNVLGGLTAYTTGGTGAYSYSWNTTPAQTTQTATGLSAGNYTAVVTDDNGCTATDSGTVIAIVAPPVFNPPVITDALCNGDSNGTITVRLGQSTPPVTYVWSGGLTGNETVTGLPAGTYSVTGTDVNNCTASATYTVNEPAVLTIDAPVITDATCSVGGTITVLASGGTPTYTYSWSNTDTGPFIDSLAAGPYNLTVTDQNSCSATASFTVTAAIGVVSFGTPVITNISCNGGSDGSITATASGGTGIITFNWSNGVTGAVNAGLSAGCYSVTIQDAAGCSASTTYCVAEPDAIVPGTPVIVPAECLTGGSIQASAAGGTGTLTFTWSNNQSGSFIDGLAAATYTLTITDQNSCSVSVAYTVPANSGAITFGTPVITTVACNGDSTGTITAVASGGTGSLSFFWSYNNTNSATLANIPAGCYSVTVSDQNNCSASNTYCVNEPTAITIGNPVLTQVTCSSGGSVTVNATGGTGTLTYVWSNGGSGTFIGNVQAGDYDLTVTDQNNCSATATFTVTTATGAVAFGTSTITGITCFGGTNGSITATASGGTGPITFNWSNSVTGATNANLSDGCYSVTASDINGCSASTTYCVTEPSEIIIDEPFITEANCDSGGTITVSASGGTGTLSFTWSNGQTGTFIDGLAAGPYILTAADQNSCNVVDTFIVTAAPGAVFFQPPVITNPVCNGASTGSITASAAGGTGPITFLWSYNNTASPTLTGIPAGAYSVTITDSVGCSASTTYIVTEPTAIIPVLNFSSLICLNTTGDGCVTATGGTPGYTYLWNNFANTSCATNLFPGEVRVTVTDAANCTVVAVDTISTAPDYNVTSVVKPFPCVNPPFGNDTIIASGGIGPFTYILVGVDTNNTGVFNNLPPGNYTWIIADSLGCTKTSVFTIPQSAANDVFTVVTDSTSCFGEQFADGSITITAESGNGPYQYSIGGGFQSSNTFTGLTAGTYTITTSNVYGCQTTVTAVVEQPAQVSANATPDVISIAPNVDTALTVAVQNFDNPVFTWTPATGLSCTDCSNPTANVSSATVFYVTVSESENSNCAAMDSVVFIVTGGFVMPNAFTPNGDGKNDDFGPYKSGMIVIKTFRIYNRWGEMVHNSNTYWDGAFNSKEQPSGTYVYYIEVETPDRDNPGVMKAQSQQGSFSLLR